MTRWYRAYEGTVNDSKLGEVALVAGCSRSVAIAAWHCILESASASNNAGSFKATPRNVAVTLQEQIATIDAVFQEMESLGMIKDGGVCAWSIRQYISDSSTERSKKHRKNKAAKPRNGDATLQKQHATAPDTDTDTDTDITSPPTRGAIDLTALTEKCREAAGWQNDPSPNLFVIGGIAGLISSGCDLEMDVIATIRAKAHACRGAKTWKFFIAAIQQARDDRLGAMSAPNPTKQNGVFHGTHSKRNERLGLAELTAKRLAEIEADT